MQTRLTQLRYQLSSGELISLDDGAGWELQVQHGHVWLTALGCGQDVWLRAGQRFALSDSQRVVIEATQASSLVLHHPEHCVKAPASCITPTLCAVPERRRNGLLAGIRRTLAAKFRARFLPARATVTA